MKSRLQILSEELPCSEMVVVGAQERLLHASVHRVKNLIDGLDGSRRWRGLRTA